MQVNGNGDITIEIGASNDEAVKSIKDVISSFKELRSTVSSTNGLKAKLNVDSSDVDKSTKKVNLLKNVFSSFKRIAFYRAIRSAIKIVTDAFQEGVENAYYFSQATGGDLAKSFDSLSTKSLTLKNQLGAAFATLIQTATPALIQIAEYATRAANAISQFIAALGGKSTYLKAIDYAKEWGDTAKSNTAAAKEWKNQLMGFDEINRLNEPTSGGGASALDYSKMFEIEEIGKTWEKLSRLFSDFSITFDDVLFDWSNINKEQIAKKIIVGVGAVLGGIAGFSLGGVPGAISGVLTGVAITMLIDSFVFDNDGAISKFETLDMIKTALFGLTGGIIGFVVGGPFGAALGATIGLGVFAGIKGIDFFTDGKSKDFLNALTGVLATMAGGAIGFFVGGPAGAAIGALIGLGLHFALKTDPKTDGEKIGNSFFEGVKDSLGIHSPSTVFADIGRNVVQGFWNGIKEVWDRFSMWWKNLKLQPFEIKTPHLSWTSQPASGWISSVLSALGLPTSIPKLDVNWYAQGGVFDKASLIGVGEAGKEAVVPLERNTEWIGKIASQLDRQMGGHAHMASDLEDANGIVVEAIFSATADIVKAISKNNGGGQSGSIDIERIARDVTTWQRRAARANG